ncbi:hypothetical protein [Pedobacter agri]|uniref:hypothetical protein n=1 Tax=Pedobacter agri TaxID=454586 RepID=UPI00292D6D90|nr:hypothetical protein [Pedobacter agri]
MDKNNLLSKFAKGVLNEISEKLMKQGKETLSSSKEEILEKSKDFVKTVVNDKISDLSDKLFGKKTNERLHSSVSEQIDENEDIEVADVAEPLDLVINLDAPEVIFEEDKYINAENFEKNLNGGLNGIAYGLAAGNPAEAAAVLNNFVTMAAEVSRFTEVQKTKRTEIEAQRDVYVERVRAQKDLMILYLEKSFDERKTNFEKLFQVVDHAITNNNMQQLSMGLESINNLASSSPFKDLSSLEATQQALTDKNHIWDF